MCSWCKCMYLSVISKYITVCSHGCLCKVFTCHSSILGILLCIIQSINFHGSQKINGVVRSVLALKVTLQLFWHLLKCSKWMLFFCMIQSINLAMFTKNNVVVRSVPTFKRSHYSYLITDNIFNTFAEYAIKVLMLWL